MSTLAWTEWDVVLLIATLFLVAFLWMVYRLVSEIIPTLRQVRRTVRELERTLQNSQEIIYNLKSITRNVDKDVKDAQQILATAKSVVDQIQTVAAAVAKPITMLRNLMLGVGYGMKYLMKRNRSYEEEEV